MTFDKEQVKEIIEGLKDFLPLAEIKQNKKKPQMFNITFDTTKGTLTKEVSVRIDGGDYLFSFDFDVDLLSERMKELAAKRFFKLLELAIKNPPFVSS